MNCVVCGSSEFVTHDGITFCTECQSQREETQAEVAVEHVPSRSISSPAPTKKLRPEKTKEYSDWITVECFNQIIFMQVSALIKLGASPKLKSTVLHVWSKYLQKCETAFRTDYEAKNGKPHLGPVPHKRDIKVLYGNKQRKRRKRKKLETSDEEASVKSMTVSDAESEALSNWSASEAISDMSASEALSDWSGSEAVSDLSECESRSKSDVRLKRSNYSSHARKLLRKSKLKKANVAVYAKKVFNMTMTKTLSICYIGLLYTEDQLLLSDLIRLVYEEKVPYLNIVDKLSSTMKLQMGDHTAYLTFKVPDAFTILKTSREMVKFLQLPAFKEPSVFLAAARFVRDLNLPNEIIPMVKKLIERYEEQFSNRQKFQKHLECVPVEYQALAALLVVMKLLFILDDKFEIEHSNAMNKLNAVYPDHKYFEWNEWKKQSAIKEYLFLYEKPGYCSVNKIDGLSADKIMAKYSFTHPSCSSEELPKHNRDFATMKNNIVRMISNFVSIPDSSPRLSTSFPLRTAVKCFMEEWRTLPMYKETQEIDFTLLAKDFSLCSLSFHPSQFDEEKDELSHLLMTSLYLPETHVEVESGNYINSTYCHEVVRTTSKYWFLNPRKDEASDISSDWFDQLPKSFKWLINFVSKYANCNSVSLYKEVARIELVLFFQREVVAPGFLAKHKCNTKINLDF